jgi:outer membrane immunogenic protein
LIESRQLWLFHQVMKKSVLLASTSLVGLLAAPSAFAADLPLKAPVKYQESQKLPWAGFYLGVNAGYAWSSDPATGCTFTTLPTICPGTVFPGVKSSGPEFGFQAGYNWQVANWVFGFETDINKLGAQGSAQFPGVDTSKGPDQLSARYDWLGTARGRVGVTGGNALFYATGGLAYGRVSHQYNYDTTNIGNANALFSTSNESVGWTVGGGAEYAFDRHWSVKAEYLYVHLAASGVNLGGLQTSTFTVSDSIAKFNNNLNIVRLGANYRF